MVTVEMALAMPALLTAALGVGWLVALGGTQATVAHAAREGARAAARGDTSAEVRSAVRQLVPEARVRVRRSAGRVVVTASVRRDPPVALLRPLAREVSARAVTWGER